MSNPTKLLTIGGSDSGGAAGIQADLKTWTALGVYGMSALTVVTAQNSVEVAGVEFMSAEFLALQIGTVLEDYGADAIKTGFIGRKDLIQTIDHELRNANCPIVIDPVLVNHRGESMFSAEIVAAYREHLFPLATLITPNRHEAALLTDKPVHNVADAKLAARNLSAEYDTAVLITGVPDSDKRVDVLVEQGVVTLFSAETIATNNTHGSGDTLSAAIAANLAHGHDLPTAIKRANTFTRAAIRAAAMQQLGSSSGQSHGHGPLWYSLKPLAS